jgi:hypothetical protein
MFTALCGGADVTAERSCNEAVASRYSKPGWGPYLAQRFSVTSAVRTWVKFKVQQWTGNMKRRRLAPQETTAWLFSPNELEAEYAPLGSAEAIVRSRKAMQALADLLRQKGIPLTIVVYPWPVQLARNDRDSRQVALWRDFCASNCKAFIDVLPVFLAEAQAHADWYERLFIESDDHYSPEGHKLMFDVLKRRLL